LFPAFSGVIHRSNLVPRSSSAQAIRWRNSVSADSICGNLLYRVLGLPFNFFWLITWLLLTPLCMWGVYRLETRAADAHREGDGRP
jgi:hypothetical protein